MAEAVVEVKRERASAGRWPLNAEDARRLTEAAQEGASWHFSSRYQRTADTLIPCPDCS